MAQTLFQRLQKKRKAYAKETIAVLNGEKRNNTIPKRSDNGLLYMEEKLEKLLQNPSETRPFSGITVGFNGQAYGSYFPLYYAFHADDMYKFPLLLARRASLIWLNFDLNMKAFKTHGLGWGGSYTSNFLLSLYAAGWTQEADLAGLYLWENYEKTYGPAGKYDRNEMTWFADYFSLDSRDPIEAAMERGMRMPIVEPDFSDHPYGKLLKVWKSENADDVREALQAYSDFNLFETLRQSNHLKHDFFLHKDLWLIPYDVAAINMRRRALG